MKKIASESNAILRADKKNVNLSEARGFLLRHMEVQGYFVELFQRLVCSCSQHS